MNMTLFRREIRASYKMILLFMGVITLYSVVIIAMFDPKLGESLNMMAASMPELFAAFGMANVGATMLDFMANYLYGFILLVIPMLCLLLLANRLVVRYVDQGSMAYLLATPNTRAVIIRTQMIFLLCVTVVLIGYAAGLGLACSQLLFPGELDIQKYLALNLGLLGLHLFLSGLCFFSSCLFSDQKRATGLSGGCLIAFLLIQMLSQVSDKLEFLKNLTPLTLFQPKEIIAGSAGALALCLILAVLGLILYLIGAVLFCRRDLSL